MRKAIVIVLLLGGAGVGIAAATGAFSQETESAEPKNIHTVRRETLKITLTERGTLKAKKSTQIKAATHGKISWMVEEGTKVKKDDVLVKLDTEQTKQQVDTLANQITQLEAELKSAETEETVQIGQNKTNIEKAELNRDVAKVTLDKLIEADIPKKERDLKLAIEKAENNLDKNEEALKASEELFKAEFMTKNELRQARLDLKTAQNDLESAQRDWDIHLKYQKPLDLKKQRAAVEEAERGLERAKQQADAQLNAKKARVQQKKVNLTRIKQRHKREVDKLAKMEIKAPTDGTVLIGDPDNPWNNQNIKVGGQVWNQMVLMTLPDSRELAVMIQVHEADIAKLEKGMKAFVTSETQKDRILDAEITKIDTVANAGRRFGGDSVKRFKVELSLSGENLDLKTGTSAEVEVLVDEIPDVLTVPAQAIHVSEGKYYCYRLKGGKVVRAPVFPGRSNDAYAEVKLGLAEGDEVVLSTPEAFEIDEELEKKFEEEAKVLREAEAKRKKAEQEKKAAEKKKRAEERRKKMMERMKNGTGPGPVAKVPGGPKPGETPAPKKDDAKTPATPDKTEEPTTEPENKTTVEGETANAESNGAKKS
jgi:RND family efflux transporter MFP subunit